MVKCVNVFQNIKKIIINQNRNFKQALSHNKRRLTHQNDNTDKIDSGEILVNDLQVLIFNNVRQDFLTISDVTSKLSMQTFQT